MIKNRHIYIKFIILSRNKEEKDILIADECHILIDPNITQTLEYLRNISKRARKYNSSIIVVTQSIEDFLNEKIKLYGQSLLANIMPRKVIV